MTAISNSQILAAADYDHDKKILVIKYQTGFKTGFHDVPEAVYRGLMASSDKDAYFKDKIESRGYGTSDL